MIFSSKINKDKYIIHNTKESNSKTIILRSWRLLSKRHVGHMVVKFIFERLREYNFLLLSNLVYFSKLHCFAPSEFCKQSS